MKVRTLLGISFLILVTLTMSYSCKKDNSDPQDNGNSDPCEGIICLNGGDCVNGICDCPPGYGGPDCGTQITPTKVRISKIIITRFPTYNNGSAWDLWSAGPDIYVTIHKGSNLVHEQPSMYEDADATLDYTYTPSSYIDLTDPTSKYTISLYDYDSTSDDDFMGGVYFYPYSSTGGFPSTLYIDAGNDVAFTLTVVYTW